MTRGKLFTLCTHAKIKWQAIAQLCELLNIDFAVLEENGFASFRTQMTRGKLLVLRTHAKHLAMHAQNLAANYGLNNR